MEAQYAQILWTPQRLLIPVVAQLAAPWGWLWFRTRQHAIMATGKRILKGMTRMGCPMVPAGHLGAKVSCWPPSLLEACLGDHFPPPHPPPRILRFGPLVAPGAPAAASPRRVGGAPKRWQPRPVKRGPPKTRARLAPRGFGVLNSFCWL